mmetsp:Transcript_23742/g.65637  ORF Transcript_23742/g.65637 Transcript_23742/m.65637 type:complete len:218 (+) Transcript_23742:84-737(+)
MRSDPFLQPGPVPAAALRHATPEVKLQPALARGRAGVRLVRPIARGELAGGLARCEVHGLEDVLIQALGGLALEGEPHDQEGIRQALDAQAYRPVSHVRASSLLHWIVIPVDDLVEVPSGDLRHLVEPLEVILLRVAVGKCRQGNGCKVADGDLVRRGVLDDLRAEVGAVDSAKVLLVGLAVGMVLVEHVGRACLHLRLQDPEPELLRLHGLLPLAG